MEYTSELNILNNIERKVGTLGCSCCLLSLNTMGLSLTVDVCRSILVFEKMLEDWQDCLPLGDAHDINFTLWGSKMWDLIKEVRRVYSLHHVFVNIYEYEADSYMEFKASQQQIGAFNNSLAPICQVVPEDIPKMLVCALRELGEVMMELSEFLASPTEELIETSYRKWEENYNHHYRNALQREYNKWKIQYSKRTLKKHVQERLNSEVDEFRKLFVSDDEFEQVYDTEQRVIDNDGLMRFLFTHAERFGVSFIDNRPFYSDELQRLFNFVELWRLMQIDLQPAKKRGEQPMTVKEEQRDVVEEKLLELVGRIEHLTVSAFKEKISDLWKRIYATFKAEISKAGSHEKFKEFSKKTVYCIIGHLKMKGVYSLSATNVEITKLLEGSNNGMRKYVNNGLQELEPTLNKRLKEYLAQELEQAS